MFPVNNALYYFRTFRGYVGNRLYLVFCLTLLAATTEGIGIALLLPLVMLMDAGAEAIDPNSQASTLTELLQSVLAWLNIDESRFGILMFILLMFAAKGAIKFAETAYKSHLQAQLMRELRAKLFDVYARMDFRYYSSRNTGHFVNLINVQVHSLVTSFDRFNRFLTAAITVAMYFVFAFMISWQFATTAVVAGASMMLIFRRLNRYVRKLSRETALESGTLNHFLVQTMQAFKYVAATGQMQPLRAGVIRSIRRLTGFMRNQGIAQAFTESLREPLSVAVLIIIIIVQLIVLDAPLAPIVVALVLIYRAMGQLIGVQVNWQGTMRYVGSLEVVEQEFDAVTRAQQPDGTIELSPLEKGIELRNVSFAYGDESPPVLRDISLTVPANQTVAFVGESGAGKSTLVDLLTLILRPTEGALEIDGVSHSDILVESWRRQIGYVSQETVIFDDTIANNICLWRGEFSGDERVRTRVEEAADLAHARGFIDDLPDGFETRVGDRGVRLSGGQKQRLFIARELYKRPRLLILDEATSALDSESELVIKETIDRLKGRTTVVIIAHRLSTIHDADQIYVMDAGRIVEHGSYRSLVESADSSFKRMVSLQQL